MNNELKTALLSDTEWLQEFMDNCVKARLQSKSCEFTNPSNLIIPPQILDDGSYDFGNPVYNNIFNKKIAKIQKDILLGMLLKSNTSDNKQFMDTLARIIGQELGFTRY